MASNSNIGLDQHKQLLDAQAHIWNHIFSYHKSMSLKCAIELGILDALHTHGKPMTLPELLVALPKIHPKKTDSVHRIMRILCNSGFCSEQAVTDKNGNSAIGYALTGPSRLLVKDYPQTVAPYVLAVLDPIMTIPAHYLSTWFENGVETPVHVAYGESLWEHAGKMQAFNTSFNEGMASDTRFVASLLLDRNEFKGLFEGVGSVVDVGGGIGAMAKALAEAFPRIKFTVLDLPQVVGSLKGSSNLSYIGGDLFEAVPPADVVLLKLMLHCWSDKECIKILKRCKEAIPSKENGGKLIIMDVVIGETQKGLTSQYLEEQILYDIEMISVTTGKDRSEQEWKDLFLEAGFNGYNLYSILGLRSVIVVYP